MDNFNIPNEEQYVVINHVPKTASLSLLNKIFNDEMIAWQNEMLKHSFIKCKEFTAEMNVQLQTVALPYIQKIFKEEIMPRSNEILKASLHRSKEFTKEVGNKCKEIDLSAVKKIFNEEIMSKGDIILKQGLLKCEELTQYLKKHSTIELTNMFYSPSNNIIIPSPREIELALRAKDLSKLLKLLEYQTITELNQVIIDDKPLLIYIIIQGFRDMKPLLDRGIDVNIVDKYGRTALFYAAVHMMRIDMVQQLIEAGADVEAVDLTKVKNETILKILENNSLDNSSLTMEDRLRIENRKLQAENKYLKDQLQEYLPPSYDDQEWVWDECIKSPKASCPSL